MYIVRAYNYNIFHSCCVWITGIRREVLLYCHSIEYYCTTLNLENTGYYLSSVTGGIKEDLPAHSQAVLIPLHIYWVARKVRPPCLIPKPAPTLEGEKNLKLLGGEGGLL